MYCSIHQQDANKCGCSMTEINKHGGRQVRLSELDMMEAELELPPVGRSDAERQDKEIESLRKVVLDLIRLVRKELF